MKKITNLFLMAAVGVLVAACGRDGRDGANGANGSNGANGTDGTNGTNGTVTYPGIDGPVGARGTAQGGVKQNLAQFLRDLDSTRIGGRVRQVELTVTAAPGAAGAAGAVAAAAQGLAANARIRLVSNAQGTQFAQVSHDRIDAGAGAGLPNLRAIGANVNIVAYDVIGSRPGESAAFQIETGAGAAPFTEAGASYIIDFQADDRLVLPNGNITGTARVSYATTYADIVAGGALTTAASFPPAIVSYVISTV